MAWAISSLLEQRALLEAWQWEGPSAALLSAAAISKQVGPGDLSHDAGRVQRGYPQRKWGKNA